MNKPSTPSISWPQPSYVDTQNNYNNYNSPSPQNYSYTNSPLQNPAQLSSINEQFGINNNFSQWNQEPLEDNVSNSIDYYSTYQWNDTSVDITQQNLNLQPITSSFQYNQLMYNPLQSNQMATNFQEPLTMSSSNQLQQPMGPQFSNSSYAVVDPLPNEIYYDIPSVSTSKSPFSDYHFSQPDYQIISPRDYSTSPKEVNKKKKPSQNCHANSVCVNCKTRNTPLWRRNESGDAECNACNQYYAKNKCKRPLKLLRRGVMKRKRNPRRPNHIDNTQMVTLNNHLESEVYNDITVKQEMESSM